MSATLSSAAGTLPLKVVAYSSGMASVASSIQTPRRLIHVPVRTLQPTLELTYQFRSIEERRTIAEYVRKCHLAAVSGSSPVVRVRYPFANIDVNGIIKSASNDHRARVYYGRDRIEFELVRSMVVTAQGDFSVSDPLEEFFKDEIYDSTEDDDFVMPPGFDHNLSER